MYRFFLPILLLISSKACYSQISGEDAVKADALAHKLAEKIDSVKNLSHNCKLTYSHDTLFNCIHLTSTNGMIYQVSAEYPDNIRTDFLADFDSILVFNFRARGACNPSMFFLVDKQTGNHDFKNGGESLIHLDTSKQIIIYFRSNQDIYIRDFKKNRIEKYTLPKMQTQCEGGYDLESLTEFIMTLKYTDELGKTTFIEVNRK